MTDLHTGSEVIWVRQIVEGGDLPDSERIHGEVLEHALLVGLVLCDVFVMVDVLLGVQVGEHWLACAAEECEVVQESLQIRFLEVIGGARLDRVTQVLQCRVV